MINRADVDSAIAALRSGGVILYPTDTVWGLGCDATCAAAVNRVFKLKRRADSKALICLIDSADGLERWVQGVPEVARQLVEAAVDPLTVVYDGAYVPPLAPDLPAPDGSLAIRVTTNPFCRELCRRLRRPLVSTSANISGMPCPASFAEIDPTLVDGVDYVCVSGRVAPAEPRKPSAIIKLSASGVVKIIRS